MAYEKWILCSERLPEIMEDVLVTQEYYDLDCEEYRVDVNTACLDSDGDWFSVFLEQGYMEDYNVIAWMPLPEPFLTSEPEPFWWISELCDNYDNCEHN